MDDFRSVAGYGEGLLRERIRRAMQDQAGTMYRSRMSQYQMRMQYLSPQGRLREMRQYLADLEEKLQAGVDRRAPRLPSEQTGHLSGTVPGALAPSEAEPGLFLCGQMKKNHPVTSIKEVSPGREPYHFAVTDGRDPGIGTGDQGGGQSMTEETKRAEEKDHRRSVQGAGCAGSEAGGQGDFAGRVLPLL